jgi:nucleoside-diphosphate-sugar epimerase
VVVRLGGIYGPGRTRLIERARRGELELRDDVHYTNRIHRDDAAGLLRHLLFHESPAPLYLGVDDESADEADVYRWLAGAVGVEQASDPEAEEGSGTPRRRAVGSKRCSNRLARESGYRFRYPTFREGYAELLREDSNRKVSNKEDEGT